MRMEKAIKKAIEAVERSNDIDFIDIADDIKDDCKKVKKYNYEEIIRLANKYYSYEDYMKQDIRWGCSFDKIKFDILSAFNIHDKIVSYKTKMAIKNNKHGILKNDPRKKAFIDISDCLTRYQEANHRHSFPVCVSGYEGNRNSLNINLVYTNKISIPFKSCFVYTKLPNMFGHVIEITDNEDGTYSGTFWTFITRERIIQMSFIIQRNGYDWQITMSMPIRQKPLGQHFTNIGVILNILSMTEIDEDIIIPDNSIKAKKEKAFKDPVGMAFADFTFGIIPILLYLGSYKNKVVHKVTADNTVYVYSDNNSNFQTYVNKEYPNCSCELVDGWLVGGHWNFLKEHEWGTDSKGKKIKGMTWVNPYENEHADIVTANEQQTRLVPNHALKRVKERYNIDLSADDLKLLAEECLKGKDTVKLSVRDRLGRLCTPKGISGCYRVPYKNNIFDVVLSKGANKDCYRIATFLPKPKELNSAIIDSKDYAEVMKGVEL